MCDIRTEPYKTMPLLALRGLVVFSGVMLYFDVGREKSVKALETAMTDDQEVFLVAQRQLSTDDPGLEDLYDVGTISHIKQILRLPGGALRVLVEGKCRGKLLNLTSTDPFLEANVEQWEEISVDASAPAIQALMRECRDAFDDYASLVPKISNDIVLKVMDEQDPAALSDFLGANLALRVEDKQALLEQPDPVRRMELLISILDRESQVLDLEQEIQAKLKDQIDRNQREYYLREQMKVIQNELEEGDSVQSDCEDYRKKIAQANLPEEVEQRLYKEVDRLAKTAFASSEGTVMRSYLDACLELPWNVYTKEKVDLNKARAQLDANHYGMQDVKERILEFLAVRKLNPDLKGQIICLVGPPGVGKTSIGKSIAAALGRNYARISLGGVRDEADIRGHRRTYIGSMPGRIIAALRQAGSSNPLLLLDEVDKLASDVRGDPAAALLEVLDPEQNKAFVDHYIEMPFDLSNVLFITTANTIETIPPALLDRMEVIELSSYTAQEKKLIAKRHLLPKQKQRHGMTGKLTVTDGAIDLLIDGYTREAGVRNLEREIAKLCRRAAKQLLAEGKKQIRVTEHNLTELMGSVRYLPDEGMSRNETGVACGLAWTSAGGEILLVEVNVMPGSGKVELTGQLGDVMKESAMAALSYIRSRADSFGLPMTFYRDYDIHVHFPEGAIPKDGPSAGITMACAMVSALTGAPVRSDTAMTGEVTIRGRVLPIGGLKEKSMAAYRKGIKRILIPALNRKDLEKVDPAVKTAVEFICVEHMDDVLQEALLEAPRQFSLPKVTPLPAPAIAAPVPVKLPHPNIRQ